MTLAVASSPGSATSVEITSGEDLFSDDEDLSSSSGDLSSDLLVTRVGWVGVMLVAFDWPSC